MRLHPASAFAAVASLLISASEPVRLQPSSRWVLDYAENSCRLIRTFGDNKTAVKLVLESDAPGEMDMWPLANLWTATPKRCRRGFFRAGQANEGACSEGGHW